MKHTPKPPSQGTSLVRARLRPFTDTNKSPMRMEGCPGDGRMDLRLRNFSKAMRTWLLSQLKTLNHTLNIRSRLRYLRCVASFLQSSVAIEALQSFLAWFVWCKVKTLHAVALTFHKLHLAHRAHIAVNRDDQHRVWCNCSICSDW